MKYKDFITELASKISSSIVDLKSVRKRGTAPTQAFSDFLTHSEQGDWAEVLFFNALKSDSNLEYVPVKYGKSEKIIAGDPGFKKFYGEYQDELDTIGKRPDILIFEKQKYNPNWGNDISKLSGGELEKIVPLAAAGFEVRSSAYLKNKFIPKKDRPFLSFTPKVEDLLVVLKWINTFNVPHFYVQVFFDGIYIISFADILKLIQEATIKERGIKNKKIEGYLGDKLSFVVEKNPKNQFKETIHIFLSNGLLVSEKLTPPKLLGSLKELAGGRLLHYVKFEGGTADMDTSFIVKFLAQDY